LICVVYFQAGGGHRSAARALAHALGGPPLGAEVELFDAGAYLARQDLLYRFTGVSGIDVYNWFLRHSFRFPMGFFLAAQKKHVRQVGAGIVELLRAKWDTERPDLVICVMPWIVAQLDESLQRARRPVPLLVVLTDLCDVPLRMWLPDAPPPAGSVQRLAAATPRALEQARAAGFPEGRLHLLSGLLVHPKFVPATPEQRAAARARFGLDPARTTAVVTFGAAGSRSIERIVDLLEVHTDRLQLLVLAGHNQPLRARLSARAGKLRVVALGFVDDVEHCLHAGDLVVGKAGGGTLGEALACALPFVALRELGLPWEEENCRWLEEEELGVAVDEVRRIPGAVARLLDDGHRAACQRRLREHRNRACAEVVELAQGLLRQSRLS
jgi:hypothetical protein